MVGQTQTKNGSLYRILLKQVGQKDLRLFFFVGMTVIFSQQLPSTCTGF